MHLQGNLPVVPCALRRSGARLRADNERNGFHSPPGRENGGSLSLQGLQASRRGSAFAKACQRGHRRARRGVRNQRYRVRLPRRMWIRSQPCNRRQDSEQCERKRRRIVGAWPQRTIMLSFACLSFYVLSVPLVHAFSPCVARLGCSPFPFCWPVAPVNRLQSLANDFSEEDLSPAGETIDDLSWRVNRMRLEEENKRRFLKAKPRFLPFEECCKWVQAFGRWKTENEWKEWIESGEKRNSYIPSRPDEYYGERGEWLGWDHFLGVIERDADAN